MKKNIAFSLFALAMLSQAVSAQTSLNYTVQLEGKTAQITTVPGIEANWGVITPQYLVREVNSTYGVTRVVNTNVETGMVITVLPVSVDADGKVTTKLTYTILEKGVAVAKGTHLEKIVRGESIEFPGVPEHNDKVTLALAK